MSRQITKARLLVNTVSGHTVCESLEPGFLRPLYTSLGESFTLYCIVHTSDYNIYHWFNADKYW